MLQIAHSNLDLRSLVANRDLQMGSSSSQWMNETLGANGGDRRILELISCFAREIAREVIGVLIEDQQLLGRFGTIQLDFCRQHDDRCIAERCERTAYKQDGQPLYRSKWQVMRHQVCPSGSGTHRVLLSYLSLTIAGNWNPID